MLGKKMTILLVCIILGWSCDERKKLRRGFDQANKIELHRFHDISLDTVCFQDELGNEIIGDEIINNTNKLFFVYSSINCMTCVETVLGYINSKYPRIGEKLIIISNYNNPRNLMVFKRVNNIKGVIYNDVSRVVVRQFDKGRMPVLFFSNKDRIDNVLWVDKSQLSEIDDYFETIEQIYK